MEKQKVPVFLLAGGLGSRISEETTLKPKPMVEIGEVPILLHIMRWYYSFGFNDFVICAGYKAWEIKKFFLTYEFRSNHLMIDHRQTTASPATILAGNESQEKWRVRVIDTGADTMTGGRIGRAFDAIKDEPFDDFAITYGDGVCDVDLDAELAFHRSHGKIGTVLGVPPLARFGELQVDNGNAVSGFVEKPANMEGLINGGFFFFKRKFRDYLSTEQGLILERAPLSRLATDGGLHVFRHEGFWQPMDTLRDKNHLEALWQKGEAPWVKKRR